MSVSRDLFLAILSMDACNRGYGADFEGLSESSDGSVKIGNATILKNLTGFGLEQDAEATGFYAIAYDWNRQTAISYSGTDDYLTSTTENDVLSGWLVGAGAVSPTTYAPGAQGQLALDFYEAVTGQNPLATEGGTPF